MSKGGTLPDDDLERKLDKLLRDYGAKLESLELTLPAAGAVPEPPPAYLRKEYFPDEPPAAPAAAAWETESPRIERVLVAPAPEIAAPAPPPEERPAAPEPARPPRIQGPAARPIERRAGARTAERALNAGLALAAVLAALGLWRAASLVAQAPHRFFPLKGGHLAGLAGSGA